MNSKISNSVLIIIFVTLVNKSFCINNINNSNMGSDLTIISYLPKLRHFNKIIKNTNNTNSNNNNNNNNKNNKINNNSSNNNSNNIHNNNNNNNNKQKDLHENYLIVDFLSDGEMERRFNYNGIIGKESSIGNISKTLSLWQVTNGIGFIQIIYTEDDGLIDCEFVQQKHLVQDFIRKFNREAFSAFSHNFTSPILEKRRHKLFTDHEFREFIDYNKLPEDVDDENMLIMTTSEHHDYNDIFGMRNLTYKRINGLNDLPVDMQEFIKFNELKAKCNEKHREMKRIVHNLQSNNNNDREVATEHLQRRKRALSDWLIAPNTKWCGRGKTADNYRQLGGASRADKCCRKHDHCKFNIQAMTTKWELFNYRPFTISHCNCDMRQRRDLSSLLRVPGTKWCGKGWIAEKYSDMGGYSKADRCCRQHDKSCPFWIMGFETKYGLFNWRINTLMHCSCDERFRTCLKMADSSDANMVGKLFFNIIQTKCFVLKPEKVCKKRLWWGKCLKKKILKRAYLRDNQSF